MFPIDNKFTNFSRHSSDLCVFMVTAQLQNLTGAALALGLTQPRLSQIIRSLEDGLGIKLFVRERRGVSLTYEGRELLKSIGPGITGASEAFAEFSNSKSSPSVSISVDHSFARFKLLPRLAEIRKRFDNIYIDVLTSQTPNVIMGDQPHILIAMAPPHRCDKNEIRISRERVGVVCNPELAEMLPDRQKIPSLFKVPLIGLMSPDKNVCYDWNGWLAAFGYKLSSDMSHTRFANYDLVVGSAENGLGIALGWMDLISERLDSGLLVQATPHIVESQRGYFAKLRSSNESAEVCEIYNWILEEFQET